ncbi:hypothetical protein TVAG_025780 [Trichomonas vaginalis G3]|uniref:Uncharacterized protein n=1 Tax=Trichomonas vaginalis (strain ATCC PRA-98 / G3) TaxID=412133 RepID=A2F0K0_TRIV3|nr:biological adhesion protein [Trichomonas vaginalis G3]EAY01580.1 hypothetical protein TVAG_025780 [Trichomonas vaginalis G3]KAI5529805.1 biological adhesion protein [Trichomonas vaginalis G3]|eukprot:XP_001314221.1 hypothetical protein [Trichomonas vaginalis G3]
MNGNYWDSSDLNSEENKIMLEQKNSSLIHENTVLKAQFENAVSIGDRIDQVKVENESLHSRLRQAIQENNALRTRLDMLLKTSNENSQKFKAEKEKLIRQQMINEDENKTETSKFRKKLITEIKRASDEIEDLSKENELLNTNLKENEAKAQRVLEAFSFYLNRKVSTLDELIVLVENLSKQKSIERAEDDSVPTKDSNKLYQKDEPSKEDAKMKKKIKCLCEKLKEKDTELKTLKTQTESLTKLAKDGESASHELALIKRKLDSAEEDKKLLSEDYEHQIKILNLKIENLKVEIAKRKEQNSAEPIVLTQPITPLPSDSNSSRKQTQSEPEDNMYYNELNARVTDLSRDLATVTNERNNFIEKLNAIQSEYDQFKLDTKKQRSDFDALAVVHEETLKELEALRDALYSRNAKLEKKEDKILRRIEEDAANKIQKLQIIADNHKEQAQELQESANKQSKQINKMNIKIIELLKENEELKEKLKKSEENIEDVTRKLYEKPQVQESDVIPKTAWYFNGFDKSLTAKIDEIGNNDNLQITSKIQNIFKLISKHYNKKISNLVKETNDINDQFCLMKNIIGQFVVDLSIAATDKAITIDELMQSEGQNLISQVFTIRSERDNLYRESREISEKLEKIKKSFGKECPRVYKKRTDKLIGELESKSEEMEKKYKKYKCLLTNLKSQKEKSDVETNSKFEDLQNENAKFKEENTELTSDISALKHQVQALTNKLRETEHQIEVNNNEYNAQVEELIKKGKEERIRIEAEMSDEIKRVTENLMLTSDNFEDSQTQINKLKSVIAAQKAALDEMISNREYQKKVSEIAQASQEKKYELEKQQLIDSYEAAIHELKDQSENLRKDFTKLSVELSKTEKSKKSARQQVFDAMNEKNELINQLESQKSQFDRERKILQSQISAEKLNAEAAFNKNMEEVNMQANNDKIQIMAYAINAFRDNYDVKVEINEKAYRNCINKTKEQISKLKRTDETIRKMVCAAPTQTTDDAVAKIIVSH